MLAKMTKNFKGTIQEYPSNFWIIVVGGFIDRLGGTMIFPFFALYLTGKFGVSYTQAGILLGLWSVCSSVGSMLGGALTDKLGRKKMVLFGLVLSAMTSLLLGFVEEFYLLYPIVIVAGTLANIGGPAQQAMVVDILPEEKRQEGYGILRVVANMSWIIGPIIGGFVANRSYFMLFVLDAVFS
ncbi:MAG: MFS transporter, partial [Anaerolineales bacterium]|nr:MFS transporter [Anaerolineales bacterium]